MRYCDYLTYMDMYVKRAKTIEVKRFKYRNEAGSLLPQLVETNEAYILHFIRNGKLLLSQHKNELKKFNLCLYTYSDSLPISILEFGSGELDWKSRTDFIYDRKKRILIEIVNTNREDSLFYRGTRYYHQYGNQFKIEEYNDKVEGIYDDKQKWITIYDDNGRIAEEKAIYNNELVYRVKNHYNKEGLRVKSSELSEGGSILSETDYFYEKELIVAEIRNSGTDKEIINYDYKFDEKGNWTTQLESFDDIPVRLTERKFEYFNYK